MRTTTRRLIGACAGVGFLAASALAATWQEIDFIYNNDTIPVPGRDKQYAGLDQPKWENCNDRKDTRSFISEEKDYKARLPEGWAAHVNYWSDVNVDDWGGGNPNRDRGKMGFGPITACRHAAYVYGGSGASFSLWSSHSQLALISPPIPLTTGLVTVTGKFWVGAANGPTVINQWIGYAHLGLGGGDGGLLYRASRGDYVNGTVDANWQNIPDLNGFVEAPIPSDLSLYDPCPPSGCPWTVTQWGNNLSTADGYDKRTLYEGTGGETLGAWFTKSFTFDVRADADYHVGINAENDHNPHCASGDLANQYMKWGTLIIVDDLEVRQNGELVWSETFDAPPGPSYYGDFDVDCDVDVADYVVFQACFNGPDLPPAQPNCAPADYDGDGDVDVLDYSTFQICFNGPDRPPADACPPL